MTRLITSSQLMRGIKSIMILGTSVSLLLSINVYGEISTVRDDNLTLELAVSAAHQRDPWLIGNQHNQDAIEAMSISAGSLPDPKVAISTVNLPVDTFNIGQENMTNFLKIGVSQKIPRGDSLSLRKKQLELDASQYPYQRQDRKAKLKVIVSHLWLDAYKAQESIALIEQDRTLFEQLVEVVEISYSSAYGGAQQQDIVRAQLELTRLDDRLTNLYQRQEESYQRLSEWLNGYFLNQYSEVKLSESALSLHDLKIPSDLPEIELLNPQLFLSRSPTNRQVLFDYFVHHPVVKALEQSIKSTSTGIDLAKQKYKPEWGVNASYGFRSDDARGRERSDFLSMGITFDIPIFTANRQDKEVESATYRTEAIRTEKWLLLRKMMASFETAKVGLLRSNERQKLYQSQLLPQMHEQAEASLTAYTYDEGDFSEVVRARIADLNAEIDALEINVERLKNIVQLNYFFTTANDEMIKTESHFGE